MTPKEWKIDKKTGFLMNPEVPDERDDMPVPNREGNPVAGVEDDVDETSIHELRGGGYDAETLRAFKNKREANARAKEGSIYESQEELERTYADLKGKLDEVAPRMESALRKLCGCAGIELGEDISDTQPESSKEEALMEEIRSLITAAYTKEMAGNGPETKLSFEQASEAFDAYKEYGPVRKEYSALDGELFPVISRMRQRGLLPEDPAVIAERERREQERGQKQEEQKRLAEQADHEASEKIRKGLLDHFSKKKGD